MNKYANTDKDIHTRIYKFVINCFKEVVQKIQRRPENIPIIEQIASSLTSVGANDREADAAGSKKDFVAKYIIVRKEMHETQFWLSIIHDLNLVNQNLVTVQLAELDQLFKIVSTIIIRAKE